MFKGPMFFAVIVLLFTAIAFPACAQINPRQIYTYEQMTKDIKALHKNHPHLVSYRSIGQSHQGREIWAVKLGSGIPNVFINGSHHGREWISTNIVMFMLDQYVKAFVNNDTMDNYDVREVLSKTSIWFVPMVNPDGVTLQQFGLDSIEDSILRQSLIEANNGSLDFRRWKTNIMGVDPNRQYPVNWEKVRDCPGRPSFANYKGVAPLTEPENIAMVEFTYEILPEIALSYHSSGHIFFYPADSPRLDIARQFSRLTGYTRVPLQHYAGGYTDWFVREFNKPAYTPELCAYVGPTNPPLSAFDEEWQRNKLAGLFIADEAYQIWKERLQSSPAVPVYYNEQRICFSDHQPVLFDGRTYVPVRSFAEVLGVPVEWSGGRVYLIEKEPVRIQVYFINGSALAPLTAIAAAIDFEVSYHHRKIWVRREEEFDLSW